MGGTAILVFIMLAGVAAVIVVAFVTKKRASATVMTQQEEQLFQAIVSWPFDGDVVELAVVGESHRNLDGTRRQDIIGKLQEDEPVDLVWEPNNRFDVNAIAVHSRLGVIGYLGRDDAEQLVDFLASSAPRAARIHTIAGGDGSKKSFGVWLRLERIIPRNE